MSLSSLGYRKGSTYEVIVTTFDAQKRPHAAPMGVTVTKAREFILRPFAETETLNTLRISRCGVINATSDPWKFFRTALKREVWVNPPSRTWFQNAKRVMAPRLRSFDSYAEFHVIHISSSGRRRMIKCKVVYVESLKSVNKPYCRSMPAVIESIIHATRIKELLKEGDICGANKLLDLIKYYGELAKRVSPRSGETKITRSLLRHMEGLVAVTREPRGS